MTLTHRFRLNMLFVLWVNLATQFGFATMHVIFVGLLVYEVLTLVSRTGSFVIDKVLTQWDFLIQLKYNIKFARI